MQTRGRTLAPTVGIAACILLVLALAAPFGLVSVTNVFAYYGGGAITPLASGLLGLIGVIVFAAGREGRTEPGLAAGVTLVLGLVALVVAVLWALTVPGSLTLGAKKVAGVDESVVWTLHRLVVVVCSGGMTASAGWYARSLGLL